MPYNLKQTNILWRLLSILFISGVVLLLGCERGVELTVAEQTGGDPHRGKQIIRAYGCQSCHTIPGVLGAHGLVGPPLSQMALRDYIAGVLPNSPDNMLRWLQNPQAAIQQRMRSARGNDLAIRLERHSIGRAAAHVPARHLHRRSWQEHDYSQKPLTAIPVKTV